MNRRSWQAGLKMQALLFRVSTLSGIEWHAAPAVSNSFVVADEVRKAQRAG